MSRSKRRNNLSANTAQENGDRRKRTSDRAQTRDLHSFAKVITMYTLYSFKTAEAICVSQGTGDMLVPPCVPDVDTYLQVNSWNSRDALNSD